MPRAPAGGNGRLSTSSALASVSASASSASSPSLPATAAAADPTSSFSASFASKPSSLLAFASSSSPGLGFLSRIGIPLSLPLHSRNRNRNRNVSDFHVRCDEPHKKYAAGEHVRGAVVLLVVKPVRVTHLVVTLHGFVRVLKDPAAVAKLRGTTTLPQGGSSSRPQYHGNGFASLFQDEQVLSGEGRLDPAKYEFGFDLVFPDKGLPSSIDFERGTISYMITATLTRPTAITPTLSCDRRVLFSERIDIGLLPPSRPRTIFLEPISKRTKRMRSSMALEKGFVTAPKPIDVASSEAESLEPSVVVEDSARDAHPADHGGALQSDVQSEVSGESGRSISTTTIVRSEFPQLSQVGSAFTSAQQQVVDNKTITATIQLLRGGCLPGDTVSVRVTVQHVKQVKSMTGVVVTLFRQCKIDSAPPSQLFKNMMTREDARRIQEEEVYPRSRTGLGGLSLSSTGSTSIFRKDLDQTTAPLIIDPDTLQASVTVPVKLPNDSFPTINGVPGDMISFKYQVEVIVDLGGRLSGHLLGGQPSRFSPFSGSAPEQSPDLLSPRRGANSNIADTSQLRRQKGVVSVSLESIIGTVDTSGGRRLAKPPSSPRTPDVAEGEDDEGFFPTPTRCEEARHNTLHGSELPPQSCFPLQANDQHLCTSPPVSHAHRAGSSRPNYSQPSGYSHEPSPSYIPPPQLPGQNKLSEKDCIRQAETRLLPSQPPLPAAAAAVAGPSSPEDDAIYDAQATTPLPGRSRSGNEDSSEPSAPTEEGITAAVNALISPAEDKQELERRRLMQEASAPPDFPDDMGGRSETSRAPDVEPTAPTLDEDDYQRYGTGAGSSGSENRGYLDREQLPAYQR